MTIVKTDYPLCKECILVGSFTPDKAGEETPVRDVIVHGWDGDKYALVEYNDCLYSFKAGYLCVDVSTLKELSAKDTKRIKNYTLKKLWNKCQREGNFVYLSTKDMKILAKNLEKARDSLIFFDETFSTRFWVSTQLNMLDGYIRARESKG